MYVIRSKTGWWGWGGGRVRKRLGACHPCHVKKSKCVFLEMNVNELLFFFYLFFPT